MSEDDNFPVSRIGDFYSRLLSNSWLIFVFVELVTVGLVAAIFMLCLHFGLSLAVSAVVSVVALILITSVTGYFLLKHALQPTHVIARCLLYIRGEPSVETLPDRNDPKYVKSDLNVLLETILDNSHCKAATSTVSDDQQKLQNILATLPIGFIAMNSARQIIASNSLAPTCLGQDGHHQIQLDFTNASESLDAWLGQTINNKIESEKIWTHVQNVAPDQPDRHVFDVIAHYRQNALGGMDIMIVTVDRTTEYWAEEDSSDFVALAAHELRGPITVIRGYLDILDQQLGPQMTPDQHELIDRLNVSAKRLASYVNNILNASRYDHKHLKLQLRETTVDGIISEIRDDMELRAKTQGRSVIWKIPAGLPTIAADSSSVGEVLSNLIDNGIKYGREGGQVEVSAALDDGFVSLSVRDNGIGIPAVVAGNLFSKFYRSHRSRDSVGGTGIGLFISRGIVESHGGRIGVKSVEGEGSTFTFTLPIYATVADKITADGDNSSLIREGGSWIKNHSSIQ